MAFTSIDTTEPWIWPKTQPRLTSSNLRGNCTIGKVWNKFEPFVENPARVALSLPLFKFQEALNWRRHLATWRLMWKASDKAETLWNSKSKADWIFQNYLRLAGVHLLQLKCQPAATYDLWSKRRPPVCQQSGWQPTKQPHAKMIKVFKNILSSFQQPSWFPKLFKSFSKLSFQVFSSRVDFLLQQVCISDLPSFLPQCKMAKDPSNPSNNASAHFAPIFASPPMISILLAISSDQHYFSPISSDQHTFLLQFPLISLNILIMLASYDNHDNHHHHHHRRHYADGLAQRQFGLDYPGRVLC